MAYKKGRVLSIVNMNMLIAVGNHVWLLMILKYLVRSPFYIPKTPGRVTVRLGVKIAVMT